MVLRFNPTDALKNWDITILVDSLTHDLTSLNIALIITILLLLIPISIDFSHKAYLLIESKALS